MLLIMNTVRRANTEYWLLPVGSKLKHDSLI